MDINKCVEGLNLLRAGSVSKFDFAQPNKIAVGMIEEILLRLESFETEIIPIVVEDGYGGIQLVLNTKTSKNLVSASCAEDSAHPDLFILCYKTKQFNVLRYNTISEYADKIRELLS